MNRVLLPFPAQRPLAEAVVGARVGRYEQLPTAGAARAGHGRSRHDALTQTRVHDMVDALIATAVAGL
jgi:hypothetical protein